MNDNLTPQERAEVWLLRQMIAWLTAMADELYAHYTSLPETARLALMESQPFYADYQRLIAA